MPQIIKLPAEFQDFHKPPDNSRTKPATIPCFVAVLVPLTRNLRVVDLSLLHLKVLNLRKLHLPDATFTGFDYLLYTDFRIWRILCNFNRSGYGNYKALK
jgi:hypothetical protein